MDDTARAFHGEVVKDLNNIVQGAATDNPDLALRAAMSVLATFITDVNRIARAQETMAAAYLASQS